MVRLGALPEQHIIDGYKGRVDFYVHCGIPCARRWPRSPAMPRSPAVQATAQVFADIARAMHLVAPVIRQACIAMAVGSNITWKDLYTSILLGGIYLPDPPVDEL